MKKIKGYARGSTSGQVLTMAAQEEKIKAYAAMQGLNLDSIITDEATTSKIPLVKRPGGSCLQALIDQEKVKAVILTKIDRAFRKTTECLDVIENWRAHGVELHIIDFGGNTINSNTSTGRLILTFFAAVAEWERSVIAERTKDVLLSAQEGGKLITRPDRIPFGYCLGGGVPGKRTGYLVKDEQEQGIMTEIAVLVKKGESAKAISRIMRERGIEYRGKRFLTSHVKRVVKRLAEPCVTS